MDISDKTRVPLFAVLAAGPLLGAYIFWMASMYASVSQAERVNIEQEDKIAETHKLILDIRERLIRIEENLISEKGER